jgi:hypothetical protein
MGRWCFILSFLLVSSTALAEGNLWLKEWIVGADIGAGLSTLVSDRATGLFAAGLGRQLGFSASTRQSKDLGLKVRLDHFWLQDWTVGKNQFPEYSQTDRIENIERGYSILGFGLEGRRNEDHALWVWEGTLGFAFTDGGKVTSQSTSVSTSQLMESSLTAKSQFVIGGSYGYRRRLNETWFLTTGIRTFLLLPPVFDGTMGSRPIFGIPLIFSVAIERQLF